MTIHEQCCKCGRIAHRRNMYQEFWCSDSPYGGSGYRYYHLECFKDKDDELINLGTKWDPEWRRVPKKRGTL